MFKNNEDLILFLKLVDKKGNLLHIKNRGYTYFEISKLMQWTIEKNYAKMKQSQLILTYLGKEKILQLSKIKSNAIWIAPQLEYKIEKIGIYDIYIPNK